MQNGCERNLKRPTIMTYQFKKLGISDNYPFPISIKI